jgi:serine/threonine protein kinase
MQQTARVEVFRDQYVLQPNPVSGGMADVYHATDALNGMREVAVKLFRRSGNEEEILKEAFKRETRALKELKHPNIVDLYESGYDEQRQSLFLVLEWLPFDLSAYIRKIPKRVGILFTPNSGSRSLRPSVLPILERSHTGI